MFPYGYSIHRYVIINGLFFFRNNLSPVFGNVWTFGLFSFFVSLNLSIFFYFFDPTYVIWSALFWLVCCHLLFWLIFCWVIFFLVCIIFYVAVLLFLFVIRYFFIVARCIMFLVGCMCFVVGCIWIMVNCGCSYFLFDVVIMWAFFF